MRVREREREREVSNGVDTEAGPGRSIIATKRSFIASDKVDRQRLGTVPPRNHELTPLPPLFSRGAEGSCRFLAGSRIVFNLPYASRCPQILPYPIYTFALIFNPPRIQAIIFPLEEGKIGRRDAVSGLSAIKNRSRSPW